MSHITLVGQASEHAGIAAFKNRVLFRRKTVLGLDGAVREVSAFILRHGASWPYAAYFGRNPDGRSVQESQSGEVGWRGVALVLKRMIKPSTGQPRSSEGSRSVV